MKNINIQEIKELMSPTQLKQQFPVTSENIAFIQESRNRISDIIKKKNSQKLVIVGPCSIHNYHMALEYATFIKEFQAFVPNCFLVMRVYFEKPRTTNGWKGYLYDPHLDNSNKVEDGLQLVRKLLIDITNMNVPIATELLDVIIPQYVDDIISWGCIGARTVESQLHRQLVSGLSFPMGFKNGTSGNTEVAVNACITSITSHTFLSINEKGTISVVSTKGNDFCNVVLRGSKEKGNNIDKEIITEINKNLEKKQLNSGVIVDLSHDNTIIGGQKDCSRQDQNMDSIIALLKQNVDIIGVMIESNLRHGSQKLTTPEKLEYGVSITDGCIDIPHTKEILTKLDNFLN